MVTIHKGYYQLPLLWRHSQVNLPNNYAIAKHRLTTLKRRFLSDPHPKAKYIDVINGYVEKGYARKLTSQELSVNVGTKWYLPHHPVVNPNKPNKVRVVFDCVARCSNVSLNDNLMRGPDLMNSLIGVLTRFRKNRMALVSKFRHFCFRFDSALTVDELNAAERALIRHVQRQHFPFLIDLKNKNKAKTFPRYMQKLQPIEIDGIVRVGGRLEKTVGEFDVKHPIILPQKCHFSQLVIRQYHVEMGHSGTSHTWASVRKKFWIVKGCSAVRRVIGQCIACRKRNAKVREQFMADLPSCRLQSFERPFYNTGVDYFGPFMIKQGRSLVKRYRCVFTCLTMRVVHIEIANSLTADSFINALRRFTARRGKPNCIFSDNGTNFVGAARILRESLEELNKSTIDRYCCQQNIKWAFMPPSASLGTHDTFHTQDFERSYRQPNFK